MAKKKATKKTAKKSVSKKKSASKTKKAKTAVQTVALSSVYFGPSPIPNEFTSFTDRAQKVMRYAKESAEKFKHDCIGTEHVLIGLIQEGNGVASTVLENLGVKLDKVEKEIMLLVKEAGAPYQPEAQLPFTPRTKQSLEHACEEAKTLDHKYIGTEHILLGLLKEGEGLAAQVLLNLGLTLEKVRKETMEFLGAVPVSKKKVEGKATGHEVEGE